PVSLLLERKSAISLVLPVVLISLTVIILPSAARVSAWRSATRLLVFESLIVWLTVPLGPKVIPPPRQIGLRIEPTRARPVPFCFHGFLPPPLTRPRVFVAGPAIREFAR